MLIIENLGHYELTFYTKKLITMQLINPGFAS